jgi:hypothetical protein
MLISEIAKRSQEEWNTFSQQNMRPTFLGFKTQLKNELIDKGVSQEDAELILSEISDGTNETTNQAE